MEEHVVQKIKANSSYQKLVSARSRFGWVLASIMMVVYYGYILLVAFNKEFLSTRIGEGVTTWGMPVGIFVIVFTIVITGIYVQRANRRFDELTEAIHKEVQ